MSGEWTSDMNIHFERTVLQNVANANSDLLRDLYNQESVALESLTIKDLGRAFGADYVIRGRLTMYSLGQEQTYYTQKTGPLRFFFRFGQRTFVGMSQARHYENYGSINREVRLDSLFGDESGSLAGDPVERLWLYGEFKPLGLLTVIVQDAATGDITWLKRTNIETMAIYTSTQIVDNHDALQAQGIRRAARQLTGMLTR
jgi:hypothetical protein